MRATGIARRVDDLGRVAIPKEIRKSLDIQEGDPLEIYVDEEGGVLFKKYSYRAQDVVDTCRQQLIDIIDTNYIDKAEKPLDKLSKLAYKSDNGEKGE